mmetsp:Transcript_92120/g.234218  ORF Transcript_92120/g.234218 Transcript_92120/m.234218 type:complete len:537 (+) Transcript_92120:33-1643(+)
MAFARDCWASAASLTANLFSCLPVSRISVASATCCTMLLTISLASVIWLWSKAARACASSILDVSSSIFSVLSLMELFVLLSSRSHHFLWSSSCFCSLAKLKIIFWIMFTTSSKGPSSCAATVAASFSKTLDFISLASMRSNSTARCVLLWFLRFGSCKNETGDGGKIGFPGASVRTPETFAKISTATFSASCSLALVSLRSAHSDFLTLHADCVSEREDSSAVRSPAMSAYELLASVRSPSASPFSEALAIFDSPLAFATASCATMARVWEFRACVSAVLEAASSSSNFIFNSLRSSITLLDLKAYFLMWPSLLPAAFRTGRSLGSAKACSVCLCSSVTAIATSARAALTLRWAVATRPVLRWAEVKASSASEMPFTVSFKVCDSLTYRSLPSLRSLLAAPLVRSKASRSSDKVSISLPRTSMFLVYESMLLESSSILALPSVMAFWRDLPVSTHQYSNLVKLTSSCLCSVSAFAESSWSSVMTFSIGWPSAACASTCRAAARRPKPEAEARRQASSSTIMPRAMATLFGMGNSL